MTSLQGIVRMAQLDRAVLAGLGHRLWQGAAGLLTLLLVGRFLSPELQGGYFAFYSVAAFQTLSDLGLYLVVANVASHEWSRLRFDQNGRLAGDGTARSRLLHFAGALGRWYGALAVGSGLAVGGAGLWFFERTLPPEVSWRLPWLALVAASSLLLWSQPCLALLEGCGQIATLNRYRLAFAVAGSGLLWYGLASGLELWSVPLGAAPLVARDAALLGWRYRHLTRDALRPGPGPSIDWRAEVWPMQWRLGVQGISQYAAVQLFTPIVLYYHGAAAAGRMGMTWAAVSGIQTAALVWLQVRVPEFGVLVARRDRRELDRLWRNATTLAISAVAGGGTLLCLLIAWLSFTDRAGAARLLPPAAAALLVAGACGAQYVQGVAAYVRAHKRELLLPVGVTASVASGGLAWILGQVWGGEGVSAAYAVVMVGIASPIAGRILRRFRGGQPADLREARSHP